MLRFSEGLAAGGPLCSCADLWIVFPARLQLVLFLLVLVIFCYPVLQRIMLLCQRHLTLNSFIASINFAWFTSVDPYLHLTLILHLSQHYFTCFFLLSMKTLSHADCVILGNTVQVKGYCWVLRTFCDWAKKVHFFTGSAEFSVCFLWGYMRLVLWKSNMNIWNLRIVDLLMLNVL